VNNVIVTKKIETKKSIRARKERKKKDGGEKGERRKKNKNKNKEMSKKKKRQLWDMNPRPFGPEPSSSALWPV
jgi:hypothetical protein